MKKNLKRLTVYIGPYVEKLPFKIFQWAIELYLPIIPLFRVLLLSPALSGWGKSLVRGNRSSVCWLLLPNLMKLLLPKENLRKSTILKYGSYKKCQSEKMFKKFKETNKVNLQGFKWKRSSEPMFNPSGSNGIKYTLGLMFSIGWKSKPEKP